MSMYRVFSCVVGRGCLLWPVHFLGRTLLVSSESLRRNGVAIMVNKRVRNAVLGCNLKNNRMISVCFQGKPFNITVIQDTVIVYYYRCSYILFFLTFPTNLFQLFYRCWPLRSQISKTAFSTETQLVGSETGIWIQNYVTPEYTLCKSPQLSFVQSESVVGWARAFLTASQGSPFSERKSVTCSLQRSKRSTETPPSRWLFMA